MERASSLAEASALVATAVAGGLRVYLLRWRSRRAVELIHRSVRDLLLLRAPHLVDSIAPYRAGYTPEQRRDLERRLARGDLRAIAATSALELGIDIGLLDVLDQRRLSRERWSSLAQQWGRAGRRGSGLAVLIASADALDQFFVRHPRFLLDRPAEAVILDPESPAIRAAHIDCAAFEAPITPRDDAILGAGAHALAVERCGRDLVEGPSGVSWAGLEFPAALTPLRASGPLEVVVVEGDTGMILGTVDWVRAPGTVHRGALYLHLGESYVVEELDLEVGIARVRPFIADWYTQVRSDTSLAIEGVRDRRRTGFEVCIGDVVVTEQIRSYARKGLPGHAVIDETPLDLPAQRFATQGVWFVPPPLALAGIDAGLGALHAAEHTLISVLPLIAMCDRWDLGGLSTNLHAQTGAPTIFVHEAHAGGIGLVRRGFEQFDRWLDLAADVLRACPCASGCPSCVQSPKCGNMNEPLAKAAALTLLDRLRAASAQAT